MKNENVIILDVETAKPTEEYLTKNGITYYSTAIGKNLVYDIGYVIISQNTGKVLRSRNYVVKDIFLNEMFMESAYYKDKLGQYYNDVLSGIRVVQSLRYIKTEFNDLVKKFNVKKVYAYNCNFDKNALNSTSKYLSRRSTQENFFDSGIEFGCIWNMACQVLMNNDNFREFCEENDFISESGNYQTSAEVCYRYISGITDFEEKHTGLEDVKIETKIFLECLKTEMDFDDSIDTTCWKIPQIQD